MLSNVYMVQIIQLCTFVEAKVFLIRLVTFSSFAALWYGGVMVWICDIQVSLF